MTSPAPLARNESQASSRRSTSLGSRLFRSKSGEALGERKSSGGRLKKKQQEMDESAKVTQSPPRLPNYNPQPLGIQSFGGENYKPRAASREYTNGAKNTPPVPPLLPAHIEKEAVDPYARTESMTHRGRYSYANSIVSTINSPRRVRRRKDPTPYNILIIGARSAGKTSFLNFLKSSLALPPRKQNRAPDGDTPPSSARPNPNYVHHYQEIEVDSERIGLTLWDSQGLDKGVVDLQLRDMSNFVESKFDDTFIEEMKVVRAPGVRDTHIHCVFFILDPARLDANINVAQVVTNGAESSRIGKPARIVGALDEDFDIQVIKTLAGKTTVIPIISKADTITSAHMAFLKQKVSGSLKKAGLDPLEALNFDAEISDDDRLDERDEDENSSAGDSEEASSPGSNDSGAIRNRSNTKRPGIHNRQVSADDAGLNSGYIPWSILSPDKYSLESKDGPVGRQFPWGFADPYNAGHCDFVKVKDAVFGEWRSELREASREVFYERWRTSRLNRRTLPTNAANGLPSGPRQSTGGIPIPLQPRVR